MPVFYIVWLPKRSVNFEFIPCMGECQKYTLTGDNPFQLRTANRCSPLARVSDCTPCNHYLFDYVYTYLTVWFSADNLRKTAVSFRSFSV